MLLPSILMFNLNFPSSFPICFSLSYFSSPPFFSCSFSFFSPQQWHRSIFPKLFFQPLNLPLPEKTVAREQRQRRETHPRNAKRGVKDTSKIMFYTSKRDSIGGRQPAMAFRLWNVRNWRRKRIQTRAHHRELRCTVGFSPDPNRTNLCTIYTNITQESAHVGHGLNEHLILLQNGLLLRGVNRRCHWEQKNLEGEEKRWGECEGESCKEERKRAVWTLGQNKSERTQIK